ASEDAVGRARARERDLSPVRRPLRRGIRWQREERRARARLREPSRLAPARAEEHEISARTEGSPPLLGEPWPHTLLGLASALQVEDPAGVDRPPAVRRHPRPGGVFLEPDIGRLGENALCALLAGRRGL